MHYFLDTSVCVAVLRFREAARRLPPVDRTWISQVTAAELWTGAEKSIHREEQLRKVERFLSAFELLNFDDPAARAYAEIRAALEKKGMIIGPLDLLIAAHARSTGVTLLTGNFKEFRRVPGLKVLRWQS